MLKMAVYCPRLPDETEESWQLRSRACRLYIRHTQKIDALDFDTLEHLKYSYDRHECRWLLVAHGGYYPLEFWDWANTQRVKIVDVMKLDQVRDGLDPKKAKSGRPRSGPPTFPR